MEYHREWDQVFTQAPLATKIEIVDWMKQKQLQIVRD